VSRLSWCICSVQMLVPASPVNIQVKKSSGLSSFGLISYGLEVLASMHVLDCDLDSVIYCISAATLCLRTMECQRYK